MLPQLLATLLLMRRRGLEFMASAQTAPSASAGSVVKPTGVAVDELAFVWAQDCDAATVLSTSGGDAWSGQDVFAATTNNRYAKLFWKTLNTTDVENDWLLDRPARDGVRSLRYQVSGPCAVSVRATAVPLGGETSMILAGFSRSPGHYGALAFVGVAGSTGAAGIVIPAGFTERRRDIGSGIEETYASIVCDTLGSYVDGAAVSFTNCNASAAECGILVEVTGT
ncbi:hypothetical protein [Phenylobacterium kunshanense]|uniref:Uncharacterized protein n=1 Tax=Phenylobacterium kunshanense TaxID=1445034 RepID=A0A328BQF1_9CAUL|nr:hypothetical protein [Phenylobacterium kunshanense]RAK68829.1 hypothetical protein DJ019_02100 [Phenylobacterium kunshanense]